MRAGLKLSDNPTLQNNLIDDVMKKNEIAKVQTSIIECYLMEYCEVNGVKETDLNERLSLFTTADYSVEVIGGEDTSDVKIGVRYSCEDSKHILTIYGECLSETEKYPKTFNLLEKYGTGSPFSIEREQSTIEGDSSDTEEDRRPE